MGEALKSARHKWDHRDEHNAHCTRCGTWAQKRPHPYARQWFTEWRLPDGSYVDNCGGGKTPPCVPVKSSGDGEGEAGDE